MFQSKWDAKTLSLVGFMIIALRGTAQCQIAPAASTIAGTLIDIQTSLPINGATVDLYHNEAFVKAAKTNSLGEFTFAGQQTGSFHVEVRANGYGSGRSADAFVTSSGETATLRITLQRSAISSSSLREVGHVTVAASSNVTLQTASTVTQDISTERLSRENYTRVADALGTLPAVNLKGLDSAIGDDVFVDIRGLKSSEVTTLLDGHPIGPLGVFGFAGGSQNQFNSYNYGNSPYFALRNVSVTYGAGALSTLYAASGVAGTVDLQTLNPTKTSTTLFTQGVGNEGRLTSVFQAGGSTTDGKLGYLLDYGASGTYGPFAPGIRTQTAFLGQDLSDAGIAAAQAQYNVSANYLLRQNLAKLTYRISPKTSAAFTYFLSSSYDDKTGNGDNDYIPFNTRYGNVVNALGSLNQISDASGNVLFSCNAQQVAVKLNSGYHCDTPTQFAQATSGPNGGGSGRYQTLLNQDYHGRITTDLRGTTVTLDGFIDNFDTATTRSANISDNYLHSFGYLMSDDISTSANDFSFGLNYVTQRLFGAQNSAAKPLLVPIADLGQSESTIFFRDVWIPSTKLTVYGNLFLKTVGPADNLLPRLAFTYRATPNDVIRLSGARAVGNPSITLTQGLPSFSSPGSTTYACAGLTNVGTVPTSRLEAESSKEVDLGYGHRFNGDSQVQINVYNANVSNVLIQGAFPLVTVPGIATNPLFLGNYVDSASGLGYASTLARQCPGVTPTPSKFSVFSTLNAANERALGFDLSGRYRVNPRLYVDYTYGLQNVAYQGIPVSVLQTNYILVNGGQVAGVPRQKASLAVDVNDGHGLEFRLDGFYVGNNNTLNGPPYTQFNGSLSKALGHTLLNLGVQNLFNVNTFPYGSFGDQVFIAENQYGPDKTTIDQFNSGAIAGPGERFFLPPRQFQLSVTQRI